MLNGMPQDQFTDTDARVFANNNTIAEPFPMSM